MPASSMRVDFGSKHFPNLQMIWDRKHKSSKTRTAAAGGALAVIFYEKDTFYILFLYYLFYLRPNHL
jgi:hypothetical protein